jgi:hypothetical protein
MGQLREFNPKMITEWHGVDFPKQESDITLEINQWGRQYQTWKGYEQRRNDAVSWCSGSMIHGRFAYSNSWVAKFFFKSKKDAMAFKLAFG